MEKQATLPINIPHPMLRVEDQDGIIYEEGTTSSNYYTGLPSTEFSFACKESEQYLKNIDQVQPL